MAIYVIMIISSLVFAFVADIENRNGINYISKKMMINFLLLLSVLPPFFVGAFRYRIGVDYEVYTNLQIPLILNNWDSHFKVVEPGFQMLIKVGDSLSRILQLRFINQYQMIFILVQFMLIFFLFLIVKNNKRNFCATLFIYYFSMFFFSSLSLMRQSLGCLIFLYSINFINEKKQRFFLLNLIGVSIHSISFIYFLAYFLKDIKKIYKYTILIPILISPLAGFIRILIEKVTIYLDLDYSQYFGSVMDTGSSGISLIFLHYMLLLIIYVGAKTTKIDSIEVTKKMNFFYYCQLIVASVATVSSALPNSFRLVSLFAYVPILSLPFMVSIQKNRRSRYFILISVVLVYSIFFIYNVVILKSSEFFPYRSVLGK
ncbi:EpsG family protein [Enterococcus pseudoavium]|uniref:EpsG family protein n=1 Tax=Enterococcus pseudoavium TaxID=44007 RepID=UPI00289275CD|nr:EpsG family protein [Enterococcus pseudoavium]MDT2753538.1 EpsG family protein [Enterococcus pseudoavium]